MDASIGEIVLLTVIASVILFAACREVLLFARWLSSMRRIRANRR